MEQEILVLSLGYHLDNAKQENGENEGIDGIHKLVGHLPVAEQNRVNRVAELARKYGRVLSWARVSRLSYSSSSCRLLAARIEQILQAQINNASSNPRYSLNDIYIILWELQTIVDLVDQFLVQSFQRKSFLAFILQDALTIDKNDQSSLTLCKYSLFKTWMNLQRNLLTSWICYHQLPYNPLDFWIVHRSSLAQNNSKVDLNNGVNSINDLNSRKYSNRSDILIEEEKSVKNEEESIWDEYLILEDQLPTLLIPTGLANKILFVGTSVKILSRAKMMHKEKELWLQKIVAEMFQGSSLHHNTSSLHHSTSNLHGHSCLHGHTSGLHGQSSLNNNSHQSSVSKPYLTSLGVRDEIEKVVGGSKAFFGEWSVVEATVKVEEMAGWAASSLYSLLTSKSHFHTHLIVLHDYFLLQDGFFYSTLLTYAERMMRGPPNMISAVDDFNQHFHQSAASKQVLGEDIKSSLFQKLRLTFNPSYNSYLATTSDQNNNNNKNSNNNNKSSKNTSNGIPRSWSELCLDYETSWPINLLLSKSVLRQYNEVFQFLFQVKRIQVLLQSLWQHSRTKLITFTRRSNRSDNNNSSSSNSSGNNAGNPSVDRFPLIHRFSLLRHQMGYFLDVITHYLHVDVLSCEIEMLENKLAQTADFEGLLKAHSHFLSQLTLQCFLNVHAFKRAFNNSFDQIDSLCKSMREYIDQISNVDRNSAGFDHETTLDNHTDNNKYKLELDNINREWKKHASFLFTLLSGVKGQAPQLGKLLLLLDYNLFWSDDESPFNTNHEDYEYQEGSSQTKPRRMAHIYTKQKGNDDTDSPQSHLPAHSTPQFVAPSNPQKQQGESAHRRVVSAMPGTSGGKVSSKPSSSTSSSSMQSAALATRSAAASSSSTTTGGHAKGHVASKSVGGPRPELLARLMKKSNK